MYVIKRIDDMAYILTKNESVEYKLIKAADKNIYDFGVTSYIDVSDLKEFKNKWGEEITINLKEFVVNKVMLLNRIKEARDRDRWGNCNGGEV